MTSALPPATAVNLGSLAIPGENGRATYLLAKAVGGSLTLLAFEADRRLHEHVSPLEAIVVVLEGLLTVTIGGVPVEAAAGTLVRIPAGAPHSVHATVASRMLLATLRDA